MPTPRGYRTTAEQRAAWSAYFGNTRLMERVDFPRSATLRILIPRGFYVPAPTVRFWRDAFVPLMTIHGVTITERASGTYANRPITGGTLPSLHAAALALDINPTANPYSSTFRSSLPPAFVAAVMAIKTTDGRPVIRWGGDWDGDPTTPHGMYDTMHFEITRTPAEMETVDYSTVRLDTKGDTMPLLPLEIGDGGPTADAKKSDVGAVQALMNRAGWHTFGDAPPLRPLATDGIYGPNTAAVVARRFPVFNGAPNTGEVFYGNYFDDLIADVAAAVADARLKSVGVGAHGHGDTYATRSQVESVAAEVDDLTAALEQHAGTAVKSDGTGAHR